MKDHQIGSFIPEVTSLTVQGFRKALTNETLKVKDLEGITKALGLTMDYWWRGDEVLGESAATGTDEVVLMQKRIERQELTIDHLNDQIVELKKRLEGVKSKATG